MPRDTPAAFMREFARIAPALQSAFKQAMQDVASSTDLALIIGAINAGDVAAVVEMLNLDQSYTGPISRAIDGAFYAGGAYTMATLPRGRVGGAGRGLSVPAASPTPRPGAPVLRVRFDGRHLRAESWVRDRAGDLIREITEQQRRAIVNVVEAGIREGRNPKSVALDLVGRIRGNERVGGMVGLTDYQSNILIRRRAKLLADGVAAAEVQARIERDTQRALLRRGETIARTETISALNAGRYEAIAQLVDSGRVDASLVKLRWSATMDKRTRHLHVSMNGQVVTFGEAFISPTGARLRFPGDRTLGAYAEDVINCRCYAYIEINFLAMAA